ncbi:MAG TPA: lysophospholipid acyltransferase family protein [Dehalococcoidia bacterium]|nr:lysophospholipid acyltransferase family protein [Dehalococcoidia bacterium]
MTLLYQSGRALARFCFNVLGRMEVTGQECVPPYGPLIVVANHVSYNDPPALVASLPRCLESLGKRELFTNPVNRFLMRSFRVHPLDRSASGVDAMRTAIELLAQDRAVVIFPEGHISPDHTLQEAKAGAAFLAMKTQAPILPVGIYGTEMFSPWRMLFPLCRFYVNIGQPFTPPVIEGRLTRDVVNSVLGMIMDRVAALLPEEYRGKYALNRVSQD